MRTRTVIVTIALFAAVVALLAYRVRTIAPKPAIRIADAPPQSGALSNNGNEARVLSTGKEHSVGSSAAVPKSVPPDHVTPSTQAVAYKVVSFTNVDARIGVARIPLPNQSPSNLMGQTLLQGFADMVSNDLLHVGHILQEGRFEIREWNLSRKAVVNEEEAPTTWHLYFDGPGQSLSGLKKVVFRDGSREEELRPQGYDCSFSENGESIKRLSRIDGSEYLLFFPSGQLREYAHRYEDMSWYAVRWAEDGAVISEKVEGPSPLTIAAQKRLIEEWKNDPYKADAVRLLQEKVNRMQSNR